MATTAFAAAPPSTMSAVLTPPRLSYSAARPTRGAAFPTLPPLPAPRFSAAPSSSSSLRCFSESRRFSRLHVRASSSEETGAVDTGELIADLKEKWDAVENKSTVLLYGGGAVVAVWLSSILVGAINTVPLLPKIMELVGLGYSGWFVYRYLLFKDVIAEA